jgi:hypothetical protein
MEETNATQFETPESPSSSYSNTDSSGAEDYKENPESSRKRLSVDFLYDNESPLRPFKKRDGFSIPRK